MFSFYLKQNDNDKTIFGHYRMVAMVEKFYDILERIHSLESGNVGYKKTLAESMSVAFGLYQGGPPLPVFDQGGPSPPPVFGLSQGDKGEPPLSHLAYTKGDPPRSKCLVNGIPLSKIKHTGL